MVTMLNNGRAATCDESITCRMVRRDESTFREDFYFKFHLPPRHQRQNRESSRQDPDEPLLSRRILPQYPAPRKRDETKLSFGASGARGFHALLSIPSSRTTLRNTSIDFGLSCSYPEKGQGGGYVENAAAHGPRASGSILLARPFQMRAQKTWHWHQCTTHLELYLLSRRRGHMLAAADVEGCCYAFAAAAAAAMIGMSR